MSFLLSLYRGGSDHYNMVKWTFLCIIFFKHKLILTNIFNDNNNKKTIQGNPFSASHFFPVIIPLLPPALLADEKKKKKSFFC